MAKQQPVPAVPRVCTGCGVAWLQRDGKEPRSYCSTSCRNEAERRAGGAPVAIPAAPEVRYLTRRVRAQEHTITCGWCRAVVTVEHYPGPAPRYCSDACRSAVARETAAERMRRMRARRQQEADVTRSESS
jgi:hypothetical protein